MGDDLSTAEIRLLDAAGACQAAQISLTATLGRLEAQGAQIIGHLSSMATMATALSWILSYRGLIAIAILFSLPSLIGMALLMVLAGQGPELLHAIPGVASAP